MYMVECDPPERDRGNSYFSIQWWVSCQLDFVKFPDIHRFCIGSAIYIYFILVNSTSSGNSSNATGTDFLLDGKHVGHYEQSGKHNDSLVYSNSSISSGNHQFSIQLSYPSYAVFDYATYT